MKELVCECTFETFTFYIIISKNDMYALLSSSVFIFEETFFTLAKNISLK